MRILVIQSGPIDTLVQSTPLLENLNQKFPDIRIDIIIHPDNQEFFDHHPFIKTSISWDKAQVYRNALKLVNQLNKQTYDYIFNLETSTAAGLLTYLLKGKIKIGFRPNLFSFACKYKMNRQQTETENIYNKLLTPIFKPDELKPTVYPDDRNFHLVKRYKKEPYICISPVRHNAMNKDKVESWTQFIRSMSTEFNVYLLGHINDWEDCEILVYSSNPNKVYNFAGKLTLLEIAALLKDANDNFLNNPGLRSIAEAINASVNDRNIQQAS
ncbi:MAG: hypothetical protein GVY19_02580 [Bacteroidetes bacterium]|jgi:heptosyltransferase-2|nr:hypothetical protein [Bacteroidota bacterium]